MNFEEYERVGQSTYAMFATTVADILKAAINAEAGSYRLQQVKYRVKQPSSLRKKLEERGLADTHQIEKEIKDLSGCRIIFYTNNDVTRFINSDIIQQNFKILEVKVHHPVRDIEDAKELYTSDHYLVALTQARLDLPEYAHFADMRCEIQIQTVLHHAWAEMAHDTIYKAPELNNFGSKAFEDIKARMKKVAQKYLGPAGYEFQKIATDFQRLLDGKALHDGDALEAIVNATDNNARLEAIEKFANNVLPFYDNLQSVYPKVVERLLLAADIARTTPPVNIHTSYGDLQGKTSGEVILAIVKVLKHYRYSDVESTFHGIFSLYRQVTTEEEANKLLELGKELAKHHLDVWRLHGRPLVQEILLNCFEALNDDQLILLKPLIIPMLTEILCTEAKGAVASSTSVTIQQGALVVSISLRVIRTKAIKLLMKMFALSQTDNDRRLVLQALETGMRLPYRGTYSNGLQQMVMDDMRILIEFQTEMATSLSLELLRTTEVWVHQCYWNYTNLPEAMREDKTLVNSRDQLERTVVAFRDVVNANEDFVIYKTLVGYNSVLLPAWEDKTYRFTLPTTYRIEQIDRFVASVDQASADLWFDRICRYALTESDDLATFSEFAKFIEQIAETKPIIALNYAEKIKGPLKGFLPNLIAGLMRSTQRVATRALIDKWLNAGKYVGQIAWYLRLADPFDEKLLRCCLDSAIQQGDPIAVRSALIAADSQFSDHHGELISSVFLPALCYLDAAGDFSWIRLSMQSWFRRPIIRALNEEQAEIVLGALLSYPNLEYQAESVIAAIAERWPILVLKFLGTRQEFSRTDDAPRNYDALPSAIHELKNPLLAVHDIMLESARLWYNDAPQFFIYEGGRFLASVFPDLSGGLKEQLEALINGGNDQDLAFVLAVLSAFRGRPCIYGLVRNIITLLAPGSALIQQVQLALRETGVVCGEFGFAELHAERKTLLESWTKDPSEQVRTFAAEEIHLLEQVIAAEHRSAETSIALRKLQYGEELDRNVNN